MKFRHHAWRLSLIAAAIWSAAASVAAQTESGSGAYTDPPRITDVGDMRPCIVKLKEPHIDGQQVGDLEVMAIATIGTDGKVLSVEVPMLATMKAKSWAKNRVQRWATCVFNAMQFEPATRDGEPVESTHEMPLKSWSEARQDMLNPRESVQAELRSTDEEFLAAYRACAMDGIRVEHRVLYQFSIDEDGHARGARALDSSTDRDANRVGHCIIERLRFEPLMKEGRYVRLPVHWGLIIAPLPAD